MTFISINEIICLLCSGQDTAWYSFCSAQEKCTSLAELYATQQTVQVASPVSFNWFSFFFKNQHFQNSLNSVRNGKEQPLCRCATFQSLFYQFKKCICTFTYLPDSCRKLEMKLDHIFDGKRLKDHVIRSVDAIDADGCEVLCFWEPDCVSFNFKKSMSQCELNNSTFEEQEDKLETNYDYIYRGAEVRKELQFDLNHELSTA